jgi:hypothetical protein
MFGIWLAVAEGTLLGFEAQRVIALRAMKIAAGGSSARSEVSRMVTEKVSAGAETVAILTRGGYPNVSIFIHVVSSIRNLLVQGRRAGSRHHPTNGTVGAIPALTELGRRGILPRRPFVLRILSERKTADENDHSTRFAWARVSEFRNTRRGPSWGFGNLFICRNRKEC